MVHQIYTRPTGRKQMNCQRVATVDVCSMDWLHNLHVRLKMWRGDATLPNAQIWQMEVFFFFFSACVCMLPAGARLLTGALCTSQFPSLTPLCQNLHAQLVSSGALRPIEPAKNEHLGSDLPPSPPPALFTNSCLSGTGWRHCQTKTELSFHSASRVGSELASCKTAKNKMRFC